MSCLLNVGQSCVLGGPGCVDGTGPQSCSETAYCAPPSLCAQCPDYACAKDVTQVTIQGVEHIQCDLTAEGTAPTATICPAPLLLPVLPMAAACTAAQIRNNVQPFSSQLVVNTGNTIVRVLLQGCTGGLIPSGTVAIDPVTGNLTPSQLGGLLAIQLGNGRGFAIPIVFGLKRGTCGGAGTIQCTLSGPALSDLCVKSPPRPGTEVGN